ncbi:hypothetical protein ZIOFF_070454 [Zingiber officinale]|uniref:dUTP diphosphatase n=1 Tax=Zingiber officinale TaxID=94328 RepID=A0A8J5CF19_ZINOF|nr:hypothetical protein ZIOFF_070454 [Zingiber officinale]
MAQQQTGANTSQSSSIIQAPLFEDQIREYRQTQRRLHNTKRVVQRLGRRITGRPSPVYTIEQQLDPQAKLQSSMTERASIVPAEVLYHSRRDDEHHRVYMHRSEEPLLVINNNQVDRNFIQEDSFRQLQRSHMQYIHLGILQIRIQTLHRQEGVLALIIFRDNRWMGDQSILATMEVDLTRGSQMIYIIPDIMMTINDFYRNIQLSILTRGYDQWQSGEANLLITRGMVGRLSNTPNTGFAYEIRVVDYLTSHSIRALPGRRYSTTPLLGLDWVIRPTQICIPIQPMEVNSRNLVDGRISVSFTNYTAAREQNDEIEHELLAVLKEKAIKVNYEDDPTQYPEASNQESFPYILVHKLTSIAVMMKNKTSGAAGFDLVADQSIIIEPRGRALVPTGLSLKIPWGTYGRIAARSSIAWKLGLNIGAGGMSIAQIIFEQIIHPNIYEVTQLSTTNREIGGFGSTDVQSSTGSNSKKKKSKSKAKYSTGRWDTLGQPSGKFDYYVNYDIPKALPDLELPPPSWDDEVVEESKPNLDVQLPKEKHALSAFLEEEALSPKEASKDLAGTTSPWASVPRSKDPFDDIPEEDSNFSYIQYLAQLSQPKDAQLSPPKDVIWDSYEDIEEFAQTKHETTSSKSMQVYERAKEDFSEILKQIPWEENIKVNELAKMVNSLACG